MPRAKPKSAAMKAGFGALGFVVYGVGSYFVGGGFGAWHFGLRVLNIRVKRFGVEGLRCRRFWVNMLNSFCFCCGVCIPDS